MGRFDGFIGCDEINSAINFYNMFILIGGRDPATDFHSYIFLE